MYDVGRMEITHDGCNEVRKHYIAYVTGAIRDW